MRESELNFLLDAYKLLHIYPSTTEDGTKVRTVILKAVGVIEEGLDKEKTSWCKSQFPGLNQSTGKYLGH